MVYYLYQGSVGVVLYVSSGIDLTDSSLVGIIVEKPSATSEIWVGEIYGEGAEGIIKYVTDTDDLDEIGKYFAQSYVESPSANKYFGKKFSIKVREPLETT